MISVAILVLACVGDGVPQPPTNLPIPRAVPETGPQSGPSAPPVFGLLPTPPAATGLVARPTEVVPSPEHLPHCANSPLLSFLRLPSVRPLGPCGPGIGDQTNARLWVHDFHHAAHIPLPRFDQQGHPMPGDGLLIYEGMRLTVNSKTGAYDLDFLATTPDIPVTLRLQLVFADRLTQQETYRLTLPPIRIVPINNGRAGDPEGNTVAINHRGYSPILVSHPNRTGDLNPVTETWIITRVGTARFGTPIAAEARQ